jgi:CO/xanthine dehydrogenase FAD-binding subunit
MAAKDLYSDEGKAPITLQPGEVLAEIQVPPPRGKQKSIYLKYRIRGAIDFPLIGVAARMDSNGEGTCTECKVVLTAVGSGPSEVPEAGELLKGRVPTDELIGQAAEKAVKKAHPVANTSGSTPTYRRKMAGILTRRALSALANELSLA